MVEDYDWRGKNDGYGRTHWTNIWSANICKCIGLWKEGKVFQVVWKLKALEIFNSVVSQNFVILVPLGRGKRDTYRRAVIVQLVKSDSTSWSQKTRIPVVFLQGSVAFGKLKTEFVARSGKMALWKLDNGTEFKVYYLYLDIHPLRSCLAVNTLLGDRLWSVVVPEINGEFQILKFQGINVVNLKNFSLLWFYSKFEMLCPNTSRYCSPLIAVVFSTAHNLLPPSVLCRNLRKLENWQSDIPFHS